MKKVWSYKILSQYRTELMGCAMLWIVFFHSSINVSSIPFLNLIKQIGYGGVDIFLMLSALGLYFSYKKDNSFSEFYKRRFLRILPLYIPVVLVFSLMYLNSGQISKYSFYMNITTLGFWVNSKNIFDWYIPALLILYLITPIYLKKFKSNEYEVTISIISISIIICAFIANTKLDYLLIFISRIPIFLLGFLVAYFIEKEKQINYKAIILYIIIVIVGIIILMIFLNVYYDLLWKYGLWWYPFIFITFPLSMLISIFLSLLKKQNFILKIFYFFGTYSLEIYLLHERVLKILKPLNKNINFNKYNIIYNIICLIITILLAVFLKKWIGYGICLLEKMKVYSKLKMLEK